MLVEAAHDWDGAAEVDGGADEADVEEVDAHPVTFLHDHHVKGLQ